MTTFQSGALALQRLRTGGTQRVIVQHVTVAERGQAVVAPRFLVRGFTKCCSPKAIGRFARRCMRAAEKWTPFLRPVGKFVVGS